MSFATKFFEEVERARVPALAVTSRIENFAAFVPLWMVMLYQVIQGTTPVLRFALSRCERFPVLARYYQTKLEDEAGHDSLLREDIDKHMGLELDALPVWPYAAEMVGRQYYLIETRHPAAYLGFIGLLEGFVPTEEQLEKLQAASGLPAGAFRTLRLHTHVDTRHREDLRAALDEVPEHLWFEVTDNAVRCAHLQALALASLILRSNPND